MTIVFLTRRLRSKPNPNFTKHVGRKEDPAVADSTVTQCRDSVVDGYNMCFFMWTNMLLLLYVKWKVSREATRWQMFLALGVFVWFKGFG